MILKRVLQSILIVAVLLLSMAATTHNAKAYGYCGPTYVVQPGDWLAKIANYCGVSTSALIAANPWTQYYYYIYPGQVLTIPQAYYPPPAPPPNPGGGYAGCGPNYDMYGSYWYVCYGDTLGKIANYYGTSWQYLAYHNGIYNPNVIYIGQKIRV